MKMEHKVSESFKMPATKLPEFSENTISNLLSLATKIKKKTCLASTFELKFPTCMIYSTVSF